MKSGKLLMMSPVQVSESVNEGGASMADPFAKWHIPAVIPSHRIF